MNSLHLSFAALSTVGLLACGTTTEAVRYDRMARATGQPTEVEVESSVSRACGLPSDRAFFDYASDDLDGPDRAVLERIGSCMNTGKLEGKSIIVVGHTDPIGTTPYNEALGLSRSERVAKFLVDRCDVPARRIYVRSDGAARARLDQAGYDRRVDIRVADAWKS